MERFVRCPHCMAPHDATLVACPTTGKAMSDPSDSLITRFHPMSAPSPSEASKRSRAKRGSDLSGTTIDGKYKVRGAIDEGAVGTIFEARHLILGRDVALKVLNPNDTQTKLAIKRFDREARAAGALGHSNICKVYDLGTLADGSPYMVLEKLSGESLAVRLAREGSLTFPVAVALFGQILNGLGAAHEKGIVHRDVKPANIFLDKDDDGPESTVKILDFGVSKLLSPALLAATTEDDMALTRTGVVIGTPAYMAPEQARGDQDIDGRADIYACGVMLYEALTGRRPFVASGVGALLAQLRPSLAPKLVSELCPEIPVEIDRVIAQCIAADRDARYARAVDFKRDLVAISSLPRPRSRAVSHIAIDYVEEDIEEDIPTLIADRSRRLKPRDT